MNPDPNYTQPDQSKLHAMVVLQPGERVICEIKRHPFGIVSMYVASFVAILVMGVLAVMAPTIFSQLSPNGASSSIPSLIAAAALIFGVLIAIVLFVATKVYWQNRWIVTDDSITQITQDSLFGRRVSQLSMENLEDITIDQHGIIQTMFDFGTLKAETAGERSKFSFQYCPNPKKFARSILEVHENFIHQMRHQPQAVNPVMPISGPNYEQQQMQNQPQYQDLGTQQMQQPQFAQPQVPQEYAQPQYQQSQQAFQQAYYAPQGDTAYQQPASPQAQPEQYPSQQTTYQQPQFAQPQQVQPAEYQQPVPQQWATPVPPPPYQQPQTYAGQSEYEQPPQFGNGDGSDSQPRNTTLPPPLQ